MSREQPPRLPDGLEFDDIMRELIAHEYASDDAPPDPWDSPIAFVDWLKGSDFAGPNNGISRYLRAVYLSRPDLSRAFPEVPGGDTVGFYRWAHEHGRSEVPIAASLLPSAQWRSTPRRPPRPRHPGVNVVGFLDDALGIGEVARRIAAALDAAGVPVARVNCSAPQNVSPDSGAPFDVNIVCINPDSLARFARKYESLIERRYTIGVWFWETEELPPSFGWAFDYVDEVWAASQFVASAIAHRAAGRVPVSRFDVPIVAPAIDPLFKRRDLAIPDDRFMFLTSFDYRSVVDRKNPTGAIEAFRRAFKPDEGPMLVVKSVNGVHHSPDRARVVLATHRRDDIVLIDECLRPLLNAALIAKCDCLVSLHRSEGFGLNIADALALGRPVIATAYGANVEYMAGLQDWLVPFTLVAVGEGQHPYPSNHRWADPDLDAAAALMRRLTEDAVAADEMSSRYGHRLAREFSMESVGRALADRLAVLRRGFLARGLARARSTKV